MRGLLVMWIVVLGPSLAPAWGQEQDARAQAGVRDLPSAIAKAIPEIQAGVSELRGLPWKSEVVVALQERDALLERLLAMVEKEIPPEEFANRERVLRKLGLYTDEGPLRDLILDVYTFQIAGFYDKDEKALYLLDDVTMGRSEILAHELIHALQDQHFDLATLPIDDHTNSDLGMASVALIEGDATIGMMQYSARLGGQALGDLKEVVRALELGTTLSMGMLELPEWLEEEMVFPYVRGAYFVSVLINKGGLAGLHRAFGDLPASTEQILHPEKYLSENRDYPRRIDVPELDRELGDGWERIFSDSLGEMGIDILLRQFVPDLAAGVSLGWDGDRLLGYRLGETEDVALAFVSVWDSEKDAAEFQLAMRELYEQEHPAFERSRLGKEPGAVLLSSPEEAVLLERRDDWVIFMHSVPLDRMEAVRQALWRSTAEEIRKVERSTPE